MNHRISLNGRMRICDWLASLTSLFPATRVDGVWLGMEESGRQVGDEVVCVDVRVVIIVIAYFFGRYRFDPGKVKAVSAEEIRIHHYDNPDIDTHHYIANLSPPPFKPPPHPIDPSL